MGVESFVVERERCEVVAKGRKKREGGKGTDAAGRRRKGPRAKRKKLGGG